MKEGKYEILIADDSEVSFRIIKEILEIIGDSVELYYVKDGKAACEKAKELLPDLILMDVIMPEMNGIEATHILKTDKSTSDIPVIVLSATESLESAYKVGANDFISKPFQKYELLIKVRSALNLVKRIIETRDQRDQLAAQSKDILDDIRYSKRIQKAIFPTDEFMKNIIPEHFILNLPKNIVSGDFYWAGKLNDSRIIAVADCTGHGISGAFMTMAGTAFLNEILKRRIVIEAADFLYELRLLVMKLLKQKGEEGEAADGMDISLIIIDEDNRLLQFAGANNPLYHVTEGELNIIKGDRMPIGIHLNFNKPFNNYTLALQPGDVIYMFSDGYADQFGGPRNKKFRYKQFQDLLLEIYSMPMEEQKTILHRTITEWMGKNEQIDDIIVMGLRI